ncbi:hypothetical protein HY640_02900 [Candidatus Woesearchaeota archaeon]|nr:hypothetical protein [Candidatus Woesearchaeota archaeon]
MTDPILHRLESEHHPKNIEDWATLVKQIVNLEREAVIITAREFLLEERKFAVISDSLVPLLKNICDFAVNRIKEQEIRKTKSAAAKVVTVIIETLGRQNTDFQTLIRSKSKQRLAGTAIDEPSMVATLTEEIDAINALLTTLQVQGNLLIRLKEILGSEKLAEKDPANLSAARSALVDLMVRESNTIRKLKISEETIRGYIDQLESQLKSNKLRQAA